MGEHVWTEFTVGGRATRAMLDELAEIAQDEIGGDGCGMTAAEVIEEALADGKAATFQGEVNYGRANFLEAFCMKHALSFHSACDGAAGAFDAGITYWAPGMPETKDVDASSSGSDPSISLGGLQRAQLQGQVLDDIIAELSRATAQAVPRLELIDTEAPEVTETAPPSPETALRSLVDWAESQLAGRPAPEPLTAARSVIERLDQ